MKPNNWVSSSQATELLAKQLVTWPLAEKNYKALEAVQVKSFDMGGFSIRAQFNPARIVSTGAKVDARSLKERKCFLCPENLPVEQERLPFGFRHLVFMGFVRRNNVQRLQAFFPARYCRKVQYLQRLIDSQQAVGH